MLRISILTLVFAMNVAHPLSAAGDSSVARKAEEILAANCVRCHGPDKQRGGLRVDTPAEILRGGDTGPAVIPGNPTASELIRAVRYEDGLDMPPSGKLSDEEIAVLVEWVGGAKNWPAESPKPSQVSGQAARKPGTITAADREWWAFRPPVKPAVPDAGEGWARTPIDRFIAEKLNANGLRPAPEADRRVLARRLSFDLVGLPPEPDTIADFETNPSSNAYEKLVDRFLDSPRHGERWARFWLDVVRYAESDGYRQDAYRPYAWRYRDYVVESLNADKPYDRFVQEQIAGDELFPDDSDALVATGFLRHWLYEYNQRDVRTQWENILTDITDTTADAFLAMGMGCARCHDHKFDPILQKDYFALRAFFSGLHFTDEPVFPSGAEEVDYTKKRKAWEEKTAAVRAKIDAILDPVRNRGMKAAADKFPVDVQPIFAKPATERTPDEQQIYEIAYRQVALEYDRAASRVPAKQKAEYEQLVKELKDFGPEPKPALAMVARDLGPVAAKTVIPGVRKGSITVEPAFPTVLGETSPEIIGSAASTGRRAALARWLTRPDHPLTARVIVNRVWQEHFGTGLVESPSDFGNLGGTPSHPELLDWLAIEFVESGWSLKHLHRLIVTSAVYRQDSRPGDYGSKNPNLIDPGNRLMWKMPVRRLDAEQVRDAMLTVSGEFREMSGGPSASATSPVRSVYCKTLRNSPDPLLASFDLADRMAGCARRNVTVTPTQSLLLMNGSATLARAAAFAKRVMPRNGKDAPEGVDAAFLLAFGRSPTTVEREEAMVFLRTQVGVGSGMPITAADRLAGWTDFCHVLLNTNEFLYVD